MATDWGSWQYGDATIKDNSKEINSYYQQFLGRPAQASEISDWVGTNQTPTEIMEGLANHPLAIQYRQSGKAQEAAQQTQQSQQQQPDWNKISTDITGSLRTAMGDVNRNYASILQNLTEQSEQNNTYLNNQINSLTSLYNGELEKLSQEKTGLASQYDSKFSSLSDTYNKAFEGISSNLNSLSSSFNTQLSDVTKTFESRMGQMAANTEKMFGGLNESYTSSLNSLSSAFSNKFAESELNSANQIRSLQNQNRINDVVAPQSSAELKGSVNNGTTQLNRKQLASYGVNV